MEDLLAWVILFLVSTVIGLYGILVGAGGGFILTPILLLLWGLEPALAVGTSIIAVWLNALAASISYLRNRRINFKLGLTVGAFAIPGSILGALLLGNVNNNAFSLIFGALLVLLGAYMLRRPGASHPLRDSSLSPESVIPPSPGIQRAVGLPFLGFCIGGLSSFLGVGGGFILTPALVYIFRTPIGIATATAIFAIVLFAGTGAVTHLILGNINWAVLFPVALGMVTGGQLAVRLSSKVSGLWVIKLLSLGLIALGITLFQRAFI